MARHSIRKKKGFDNSRHYDKEYFAVHVVRKGQQNIDFKNFRLILDRLRAAIRDYAKRKSVNRN